MKIKSFECPKSIKNYEKKMLETSDAWSTSGLSHWPSKPAYYIVDCRILDTFSAVVYTTALTVLHKSCQKMCSSVKISK